ncbi:hypothetical protein LTR36_008120 [Oleoguttula mirabilis]|uniref:RING-type domain-containing protein n=1 Tax=Oleoguttula mirabilis TaxID=1507867 RepID=A0AAV9J8E6_9PEZI|nr:hypothetical protein LTR36_008120 [Oleoguttula mirabilis]
MTTAVSMIKVHGLSDEQRQLLSGAKIGDMVLFEKQYAPVTEDDAESESESESEEEDAGDDEEQGEQDEGAEDSGEAEDEAAISVQGSVNDGEGNDQQDGEDGETDTEPTSEEEEEDAVNTTCLYLVINLVCEDGAVTDIALVKLQYHASIDIEHAFQIYGTEVHHDTAEDCTHLDGSECEALTFMNQLGEDNGLESFTLRLNPDGDFVRTAVLRAGLCPAGCGGGWLTSLDKLQEYIHPDVFVSAATVPHQPVCPICIGLDLLKEQQTLRILLESHQVDFGDIVEFMGRLNIRRKHVGHRFYQFDEREWAMHFDDMISEASDDDGNAGAAAAGGQWQQWDEAFDPNATVNVRYRPASDAAIAALQRLAYEDVAKPVSGGEKAAACVVCMNDYEAETVVAVLPTCGHFSCDGPCTEQWLKQFSNCPTCRKTFATEESEDVKGDSALRGNAEDGATTAGFDGAGQEVEGFAGGAGVAGTVDSAVQDDVDVVMSDT